MNENEALRALESCLLRKRRIGEKLFNLDARERWGMKDATAEQRAQFDADEAAALTEHTAVVRELTDLSTRLRKEMPLVLERWADVHVAYLRGIESDDRVVLSVAQEEISAWERVARGEQPFVEENVYYVKIDPARYASVFGFPPPC